MTTLTHNMTNLKTLCAALVLGGLAAAANAGPILIVSGISTTTEVGTTNAVVNNLQALHLAA
ncbi:MAG: hypothetical protein K2W93_07895, partial [Burkholderiaceae bacterium]|nr:hypothetical protein [Burkholderiaceae bacterium]